MTCLSNLALPSCGRSALGLSACTELSLCSPLGLGACSGCRGDRWRAARFPHPSPRRKKGELDRLRRQIDSELHRAVATCLIWRPTGIRSMFPDGAWMQCRWVQLSASSLHVSRVVRGHHMMVMILVWSVAVGWYCLGSLLWSCAVSSLRICMLRDNVMVRPPSCTFAAPCSMPSNCDRLIRGSSRHSPSYPCRKQHSVLLHISWDFVERANMSRPENVSYAWPCACWRSCCLRSCGFISQTDGRAVSSNPPGFHMRHSAE